MNNCSSRPDQQKYSLERAFWKPAFLAVFLSWSSKDVFWTFVLFMLIWRRLVWFKCSRKAIIRTKRKLINPKWHLKRKKKLLTCKKLEVWGFHFSSGLPCHVLSMLKHTWKSDIVNTTDKHYDKIVLCGQNRMLTLHSFFWQTFLQ